MTGVTVISNAESIPPRLDLHRSGRKPRKLHPILQQVNCCSSRLQLTGSFRGVIPGANGVRQPPHFSPVITCFASRASGPWECEVACSKPAVGAADKRGLNNYALSFCFDGSRRSLRTDYVAGGRRHRDQHRGNDAAKDERRGREQARPAVAT